MSVGNKGGCPRKPTALHLLNGNPSKIPDLDARAAAEPKPMEIAPGAVPELPEYIGQFERLYEAGRIGTAQFVLSGLVEWDDSRKPSR